MPNPDASVGIKQATVPDAYIDNEQVANAAAPGGLADRQRVGTPDLTAVQGATTDVAVTGDNTGTASGKLRGLVKILSAVWDSTKNLLAVKDDFYGGEGLPDQVGAGAVLTFTFSGGSVNLVWVRSVGGISRADPWGGTPTATQGVYCAADEPAPITVVTSSVKVFAPSGAAVSVWGYRR